MIKEKSIRGAEVAPPFHLSEPRGGGQALQDHCHLQMALLLPKVFSKVSVSLHQTLCEGWEKGKYTRPGLISAPHSSLSPNLPLPQSVLHWPQPVILVWLYFRWPHPVFHQPYNLK